MSKNVLKDRGIAKTKFLEMIMDTPEICELLLDSPNYTEDERNNLVYSQVFPFLFINDTQKEVLSYICFEIKIPRASSSMKHLQLIIWACCHKDAMQYFKEDYVGDRADILADMISRQLCDSKDFGIGKIQLEYVNTFYPNAKYYAIELIYDVVDFKVKDN